jgi:hypothetical protein
MAGHRRRREDERRVREQLAAFKEFCELYWALVREPVDDSYGVLDLEIHRRDNFYRNLLVLKGRHAPFWDERIEAFEITWEVYERSLVWRLRVSASYRSQATYKRMRAYYERRRKEKHGPQV